MVRHIFLLCFIFFLFGVHPRLIYSQSVSPPPAQQNQNPLSAIFAFLFAQNTEYLDPYVASNTPPNTEQQVTTKGNDTTSVLGAEEDVQKKTAINYGLSRATRTPIGAETSPSFLDSILTALGFQTYSNEAGRGFANSILPYNTNCTQESCFQEARCAALPPNQSCSTQGVAVIGPSQSPIITLQPSIPVSPPPLVDHAPDCPTGTLAYFSQRDPAYANISIDGMTDSYGPLQQCNVLIGGCGPVAMSMILSCYLSARNTPDVVIQEHYQNLTACYTDIFQHINLLDTLFDRNSSFHMTGIFFGQRQLVNENLVQQFRSYIDSGSTILAVADINNVGHFFWITDVTEDGTIYVMDPYYGYLQPVPMDQAVLRNTDGTGEASIIYKSAVAIGYTDPIDL